MVTFIQLHFLKNSFKKINVKIKIQQIKHAAGMQHDIHKMVRQFVRGSSEALDLVSSECHPARQRRDGLDFFYT